MKTLIKSLTLAYLASASILLSKCSNQSKANHEMVAGLQTANSEEKYSCTMHSEVFGKKGGSCPKCGMKLELVNEEKAANRNEYFMDFKANPTVEAGKEATLSFKPSIKGKENEMVELETMHDKKIHLIIVSKDLSYFDHVHPELKWNGTYDIEVLQKGTKYSIGAFENETRFDQAGDYIMFADYSPSGANHQLDRIELNVPGVKAPEKIYTTDKLVSMTDGYEVSLVPVNGKFFNEGTSHIWGIVKKNGKEIPANQFEDFLAAKAHVVMISMNAKNYLHVHPAVVKGRLGLHATFGTPGIFRGWLQFKTNDKVHTADFVIKVEEGKSPQHSEEKHQH